jgi:hypothetical protein
MPDAKQFLYEAIKAQVKAKAPSIKHILLFNNQFENERREDPIEYPNCFVELSQIFWTSQAQGQQVGDVDITIHIGLERYERESDTTWTTIQEVFLALQGFAVGVLFSPLNRIEEVQDTDHDNVIVWKLIFKTSLIECDSDTRAGLDETTIADLCILTNFDVDNPIIRTGDGDFS